jgi:hypothetical protein
MIDNLSPTKAFINVDFQRLDSLLYLQNLLYVTFTIYLFCKGSYIKSIDKIKHFLILIVANDELLYICTRNNAG